MNDIRKMLAAQQRNSISQEKEVYIYAQVDIDKAYLDILSKSKKIRSYLQEKSMSINFTEKMRNYKNFRICFDNQIQKYIHHKQLNSDLRLIKKNVFNSLEEFIISRYEIFIQEQRLHVEYKNKVLDIEQKFSKRFEQLMKHVNS